MGRGAHPLPEALGGRLMRLPFMQLESDLLAHGAPQVGSLAGCSPIQALGHIAYLRAWAVAQATDEAPPDGWARGPDAADAIEAAACWGGEPGRLLRALKVAKVVIVTADGVQVQGMEPYAKAWEQNAKAKERMRIAREQAANKRSMRAERSANSGVTEPNEPRNESERPAKFSEQTQTYTQKKETTLPPADASGVGDDLPDATEHAQPAESATQTMANAISLFPEAEAPKPEKSKRKAEPKGDPRHAPLVDALVKADAEVHGVPYGFRGGRDAKAVSECLALADQNPATSGETATAEILRRWRIARRWKGFPACNSLGDLATHWNAYARAQDGSAGPPPPTTQRKMIVL